MEDLKLSEEQWQVLAPLLPPQPRTGRRREHDRQVLNSLVYRLKTRVQYKDIPKDEDYAAKSTVYHWLSKWSENGVLDRIWRQLLTELTLRVKLMLAEEASTAASCRPKGGRGSRSEPTR